MHPSHTKTHASERGSRDSGVDHPWITCGSRRDHVPRDPPGTLPGPPWATDRATGRQPTAPHDLPHVCMHVVAVRRCRRHIWVSHAFTCGCSEVVQDPRCRRARATKMSTRFPSPSLFPTRLFRCSFCVQALCMYMWHAHARVHGRMTARMDRRTEGE